MKLEKELNQNINIQNVFDINDFINKNKVNEDLTTVKKEVVHNIHDISKLVKEHFDDKMKDLTDEQKENRQTLEHRAVLGDKNAEKLLVPEINNYLTEQNLQGVKYPDFFDSLAHAIYHEIYGFSVFYKWETYPNSVSAKIIGKELWFKIDGQFVKQEEELRDENHIYEIFRALEVANKGFKLNEGNPKGEIQMANGNRVTLSIPPFSHFPEIVFRRFIVKSFSFENQAKLKTIPYEDIQFYKDMSNLYLNTVIAGHVESGKSTMLKTIYGSRDPNKVAVMLESSPETFLKRDFPNRLVHDYYTLNDIEGAIRHALRVDHDYMIFQEVRGLEAEGAMKGAERGTTGLLMSYHITDPADTVDQLAGHIVDEFPNRKLSSEKRRIAKLLDLGLTMETYIGNIKKVTSMYEICYDRETNKAWINYLKKYNEKDGNWYYNPNISDGLKKKMYKKNDRLAMNFISHLKERSEKYPMQESPIEYININD